MPRKNRVPTYCKHPNGQAYVQHRLVGTKDHRQYLGKYGTERSLRRYRQFLKRLEVCQTVDRLMPIDQTPSTWELVVAYDEYAKEHYKREFGISKEYSEMVNALKFLNELYGEELGEEFGPKGLKTIQRQMVSRNYARSHINHTTSRIKRFFRWACSEELIPPEIYHKLACVRGLQRGELGVRESKRIRPACPTAVEGVVPFLSPTVATMIRTQYLCGMRPGEVCAMREDEIDRSGDIWWYRPESHKGEWRGQDLVKAIPRTAQTHISEFIKRAGQGGYLFKPQDSIKWFQKQAFEESTRNTPRYPCEVARLRRDKELRRRRKRQRPPGEHYTTASYRRAIDKGFERAELEGLELERFSPNRLRHAILSFVSGKINQQSAQRYAGHKRLETTSIYVEIQKQELEVVAHQLDAIWDA